MPEVLRQLRQLVADTGSAVCRFPVAALGVAAWALAALLLAHLGRSPLDGWLFRCGLALTVAGILAGLTAEGLRWSRSAAIGLAVALATAILIQGLLAPTALIQTMFIVGLLAALFVVPSLAAGHAPDRSWAYGSHLLERLGFACAAGIVAYVGLLLLQGFLRGLLQIPLPATTPIDTMIFALIVIPPLVFLARIFDPATFRSPERTPEWLSRFTIWLCVPLAIAYLALLEMFVLRSLLTRQLSGDWMVVLTTGIAVLGVLAHLLAYPLRKSGPAWVRYYHRFFYLLLIPVLLVSALALGQQIMARGVTEDRYLGLLLLLWLALLAACSLRQRWWRPALVPASLSLLLIVASVGPWNPHAVTLASQLDRFERLIAEAGMVDRGLLIAPDARRGALEPSTAQALAATVTQLIRLGHQDRLARYWPDQPAWVGRQGSMHYARENLKQEILADLGVPLEGPVVRSVRYHDPEQWVLDVAGFARAARFRARGDELITHSPLLTPAGAFTLSLDWSEAELRVGAPDGSLFAFALEPIARQLAIADERRPFMTDQANAQHRVRLTIHALDASWQAETSDFDLGSISGFILVE